MALYAGFHDQIRPLQSGAWRFCREPSGCDLEYKKDMTSTFATQFSSLWVYPEKEIDKLVESLDAKDEIYIRILTYALKDEYVSFRTFSQGTWNIKF
ncbi:hypothetical protein [Alistipes putredinis]|uniref:hypothetical protein n=1 Tax=Alistipes putredinis TaxID=28117 RepID=UPI003A8D3CB9